MTEQTSPAQLDLDSAAQPPRVYIRGDWVLAHYCVLEPRVAQLRANMPSGGVFDLNQLGALDTAGATLLALLLGEDRVANLRELAPKLPEERRILLETVSHVLPDLTPELSEKPTRFWLEMLANTGRSVDNLWQDIKEGANKRGNSSRLTQSFHFFMFEPIFSPVNALNQPI